jgi:hypothetical protein
VIRLQDRRRFRGDALTVAALAFLTANLLHGADHVRQQLAGVNSAVMLGGAALTAAAVAVVVLVIRQSPHAPLFATAVGVSAAVGVAASHIAPHWGLFSDSYVNDIHPDPIAWAVMLLEVASGVVLGAVGARRVWSGRYRAPSGAGWAVDRD